MLATLLASALACFLGLQSGQELSEVHSAPRPEPYLDMSALVVLTLRTPRESLEPDMAQRINDLIVEGIVKSATYNHDFQFDISAEGVGVSCFLKRYLESENDIDLSPYAMTYMEYSINYLEDLRDSFESSHPGEELPRVCGL